MYYLRSTAAADAIKFTLDKTAMAQPTAATVVTSAEAPGVQVAESVVAYGISENQQTIPYENAPDDYDQKRADMTCSLDNPEGCEACGS